MDLENQRLAEASRVAVNSIFPKKPMGSRRARARRHPAEDSSETFGRPEDMSSGLVLLFLMGTLHFLWDPDLEMAATLDCSVNLAADCNLVPLILGLFNQRRA